MLLVFRFFIFTATKQKRGDKILAFGEENGIIESEREDTAAYG